MENQNQSTALLVMDVQVAVAKILPDGSPVFNSLKKALQTARNNKIPVIYAVIGFRKGYPEVSPNNRPRMESMHLDNEEEYRVHSSVAPQQDDVIVIKKRVSAFTGSDLEVVLRGMGIKHLVLTGIATSGVVLSTLREASDKDYKIIVLSDCCADRDEEVHRVLTTKVFIRQAEVMTADEWSAAEKI